MAPSKVALMTVGATLAGALAGGSYQDLQHDSGDDKGPTGSQGAVAMGVGHNTTGQLLVERGAGATPEQAVQQMREKSGGAEITDIRFATEGCLGGVTDLDGGHISISPGPSGRIAVARCSSQEQLSHVGAYRQGERSASR